MHGRLKEYENGRQVPPTCHPMPAVTLDSQLVVDRCASTINRFPATSFVGVTAVRSCRVVSERERFSERPDKPFPLTYIGEMRVIA
jgi:hypothetical protein